SFIIRVGWIFLVLASILGFALVLDCRFTLGFALVLDYRFTLGFALVLDYRFTLGFALVLDYRFTLWLRFCIQIKITGNFFSYRNFQFYTYQSHFCQYAVYAASYHFFCNLATFRYNSSCVLLKMCTFASQFSRDCNFYTHSASPHDGIYRPQ